MAKLTAGDADPDGAEHEIPAVTAEVYDFPAKEPPRTKKQRKHALREKQDRERSRMIGDFVYECLDVKSNAASLTRTKSGGYASGGSKGAAVYNAFVNWCNRNGAEVIDYSPFGRLIKQYVDAAKAVKGVYYGAVIRQTIAKRRAA
jgi:phage/plasmid-associated DNA primase